MKVLQICAYAAPYEGNFMKSLYALEQVLNRNGYEMVYAFPESAKHREWCQQLTKRKKVYFLPLKKARIRPKTYLQMMQIFKENPDISVVHSHFELYDLPVALVSPKRVNVFWHRHDALGEQSLSRTILEKLQYGFVPRKVKLISVAEKYRKDIVAMGFPEEQAITILNGIDLDRIKEAGSMQKKYDFLAYVWDNNRKGCDILLEAGKRLFEDGYKIKIMLVGNEETKQYIDRIWPCSGDIITLRGACDDVNELYRDSWAFISASRRETFSYAVCEAAYAGLQVISSDIPGLEWAKKLPTVLFFSNEDVGALRQCMQKSLEGRNVNHIDVKTTREYIKASYSAESWAEKIFDAYGL